ncbi:hypothetical protein Ae168Ps1_5338c [Pseudonocardia sp. Ae168_Ps1]|uniref:hypothetical protein n=1 Tax=unclassified Pseudonocardia TaxID=2619320 RepID=UPI00095FD84A|nr:MULTISPECIES: hypothetical protein [unclassified Pseudonocardia]OLL76916.1 hypothetical protein Ae150APs1_5294c [Pseudonocardia sp. Ae150A_Ps1]OLL82932.1 hypothetical protein Ae168Ps1_5338c [Pseudonocardia sp. Ae168_Ps1]OLL82959.1 hypothetical protein Ae263Ps1_0014 [Pseudonocardia sp. Ae263_Ps1]OLL91003.1 hypothetical protein Ae356Ps1_0900c [Pseudonocardia sp. Ae356_Ps1]
MSARPVAGPLSGPLWTAPGLRAEPLCPPNPLWASNGIAFGPDGRLWIAQFLGGTVGALDLGTGEIETVLGPDGPLTAPDDLVFGDGGELFVVDLPAGLVWRRDPDGATTVVADGIVAPDGIAWHRGRLFVNELVPEGRLLEIDLAGGPPRVLADDLALGNAMQVGPDGFLYYPHLLSGEVWRVDPDGGTPERVLAGLDRPVAVRFDPAGRLRILSNGERGTLWTHDGDGPLRELHTGVGGADNVAFAPDGTAYVSGAFHGGVHAVDPAGTVRVIVPEGLNGPFGIAATPDGILAADHFGLALVADGRAGALGDVVTEVRGGVRGIARRGGDTVLTTDAGGVWRGAPGAWKPLADGLGSPTGVAEAGDGVLVAETAAGRVLHVADDGTVTVRADGLDRPVGVATGEDGRGYVTTTGGGRVLRLDDDGGSTVLGAGLHRPEGLAASGGALWCAEAGTGRLLRIDPVRRATGVAASGLAFDVRPPHVPDDCRSGAARRPAPFAGVTADGDGIVVACTGAGNLVRLGS